jgi:hypothetical protein
MVKILNFKKGVAIIKLNVAVTNLNVRGILMFHCGRDKNAEYMHLTVGLYSEDVMCFL